MSSNRGASRGSDPQPRPPPSTVVRGAVPPVPASVWPLWSTFQDGRKVGDESQPVRGARTCFPAQSSSSFNCYCRFKISLIHSKFASAAAKVGEKCFSERNMELQGLQEALKVEIQCHQVKQSLSYSARVAVVEQRRCEAMKPRLSGRANRWSMCRRHRRRLSAATHRPLPSAIKVHFPRQHSGRAAATAFASSRNFGTIMRWNCVAIRTRPEYL